MLAAALRSVQEQQFTTQLRPRITVLVVDNDEDQSGRRSFEEAYGFDNPIARYVVACPKGIARARNRALEESAEADFVAFLDDDEFASPLWLQELIQTQHKFGADVVTGPVIPEFDDAPNWVVRGRFFDRKMYRTGTEVNFVASGNTLIRGSVARRFRFDHRFDQTGSEDTHFFLRVRLSGALSVWANEAVVHETVPKQRTTGEWILRRAYCTANGYTRSCLYSKPGIATFASRLGKAAGSCVAGAVLLPSAIAGRDRAVRALRFFYRASGTVAALREYAASSVGRDRENGAVRQEKGAGEFHA